MLGIRVVLLQQTQRQWWIYERLVNKVNIFFYFCAALIRHGCKPHYQGISKVLPWCL